MDSAAFLHNFATIAEAPGGIDRLREMVLRLAVRGQLVTQSQDDQPANELLLQIQEIKHAQGLDQRRHQATAVDSPEAGPYDLPESWEWCRLDRFVHLEMGQSPASKFYNQQGDGMPFFQGKADFGDLNPEPRYWCTQPTKVAHEGDVLISVRAPVGPTNVATETCCIGRGLAALRPLASTPTDYVLWMIRAFELEIAAMGTGTTFVAVTRKSLAPFMVPVPPRAEQHRIVEKVNELMALCDDLEARQQTLHQVTTRLRTSALEAFTTAAPRDGLANAWERVQENWDVVGGYEEGVEDLQLAIATLAVRGRLGGELASEDSADGVIRKAAEALDRQGGGSQSRGRTLLAPISTVDHPLELPRSWRLVRLGMITDVRSGVTKGRRLAPESTVELPYLRVANVKAGHLLLDDIKTIPVKPDEVEKYRLRQGDVLLTEGGDWDKLGRSAIWRGEIELCLHQNHIFRARPLDEGISPEWLSLVTNSSDGRAYFQSKAKRTTNLASINMTELRNAPIPLPPPTEQKRIVSLVRSLLDLCDRLGDAAATRDEAARALAGAATRL